MIAFALILVACALFTINHTLEEIRDLIFSGFKNGDGYGKLIGFHDHKICKSSGWRNFMWGGDVRKATPDEVTTFMNKIFNSEPIKNY